MTRTKAGKRPCCWNIWNCALVEGCWKVFGFGFGVSRPRSRELSSRIRIRAGAAMEVQNGINTNTLYGPTDELAKTIFKDTGCSPVAEKNMNKMGTAGCTYFSIFQNTAHSDHEFAANCVPGLVCSADVVGMTKGLIATYGVVMQILQPNLGSLANIYSGPIDKCYDGMNKLNGGDLKDSFVTTPIMGPFNLKLGETTKLVVEGMGHVGALDSLKTCQDGRQWAAWRDTHGHTSRRESISGVSLPLSLGITNPTSLTKETLRLC